jgi:heme/copper-type cytochrome/quinol oxidase subunit 1
MTTIDPSTEALGAVRDGTAAGPAVGAIVDWLTTSDHKRIGRLFVGTSLVGLLATATVGVLLGIERVDGDELVFDADALSQMYQAFRIGLVLAALIPLGLGLAIAVVPLQLGARALAFPRIALTGFYGWLGGLVLVIVALSNNGGVGGGDADMVDLFLAGQALAVLGLLAAAGSVATTVLTTRAPGMTMRRVPFFAWSALVSAIGLLLVGPVLVGTVIFLFVDHRNARATFGGNEGIGPWIGWFFTQPTTYLFALPAIGIAAELVPVTVRRRQPMRGVVFAGLALVAVGGLSGVTRQGLHELPWPGSGLDLDDLGDKLRDLVPYSMFNLLPVLGVLIVMGLGALAAKGSRPRPTSAFAFALLGVGMVFVGMLGGVLYPIDDLGLQGTVFEEGSLVAVAYGSVLAVLGGILYWAPKLWGRVIPEKRVAPLVALGLVATVLASLPYYVAGFADQPAGSALYDYEGPAELWNILALAGHALMALTVVAFAGLAMRTLTVAADRVDDDPWRAQTIEWTTTSPAPRNNFSEVPTVSSPEPLLDLEPVTATASADESVGSAS